MIPPREREVRPWDFDQHPSLVGVEVCRPGFACFYCRAADPDLPFRILKSIGRQPRQRSRPSGHWGRPSSALRMFEMTGLTSQVPPPQFLAKSFNALAIAAEDLDDLAASKPASLVPINSLENSLAGETARPERPHGTHTRQPLPRGRACGENSGVASAKACDGAVHVLSLLGFGHGLGRRSSRKPPCLSIGSLSALIASRASSGTPRRCSIIR